MSTNAMVYLKLREEDYGKTIVCDAEKLPNPLVKFEFDIRKVKLPKPRYSDTKKLYVGIYVHHDGYPSGVGKELKEKFTTYEDVLNLIALGDCSYICDEICSYHTWRNEELVIHKSEDHIPTSSLAYTYVFENDEWS